MISDRPGSHIAAMLFFATMILAGALTGHEYWLTRNPQAPEQIVMLAPYLLAAAAMYFSGRWSYLYCAFILFLLPAFLTFQATVLLFKTDVPLMGTAPLLAGIGILFWLFYAYTFGPASRKFYAAIQLAQT